MGVVVLVMRNERMETKILLLLMMLVLVLVQMLLMLSIVVYCSGLGVYDV